MSGIFVLTEERKLIPLVSQQYATEDLLQSLLADYPDLMAGDQIRPDSPRRWLLVKREADVPGEENGSGRWSLDHLFLDQDGVPTLVEVKRSTDTRIRREVIGQMLDYAANGVKYWPIEALRSSFEATCEISGNDPDVRMRDFLGEDADHEEFWKTVKTNLQAGRIRMLFVADEIPDELRRIVEFLNEQMDPAEVLAIEIKQFVGGTLKTLVPRVIGQTVEAEDRKRATSSKNKRKWDETLFFSTLHDRDPSTVTPARKLLEWAQAYTTRVWWGEGQINGSFIPVIEDDRSKVFPFAVYTHKPAGKPYVQLYFEKWAKVPPFTDRAILIELLVRFSRVPDSNLITDDLDGWAGIPLAVLASPGALTEFIGAVEWMLKQMSDAKTGG